MAPMQACATHPEPDCAAALLDSLHGVLYLEQAALGAPCGDVRVILQEIRRGALWIVPPKQARFVLRARSTGPGCGTCCSWPSDELKESQARDLSVRQLVGLGASAPNSGCRVQRNPHRKHSHSKSPSSVLLLSSCCLLTKPKICHIPGAETARSAQDNQELVRLCARARPIVSKASYTHPPGVSPLYHTFQCPARVSRAPMLGSGLGSGVLIRALGVDGMVRPMVPDMLIPDDIPPPPGMGVPGSDGAGVRPDLPTGPHTRPAGPSSATHLTPGLGTLSSPSLQQASGEQAGLGRQAGTRGEESLKGRT